jgi:hypothetical protein
VFEPARFVHPTNLKLDVLGERLDDHDVWQPVIDSLLDEQPLDESGLRLISQVSVQRSPRWLLPTVPVHQAVRAPPALQTLLDLRPVGQRV